MPRKPKIVQSVKSVLSSQAFQDVIRMLEADHPLKKGLDHNASIECRALYQIRIQEYEAILIKLRLLANTAQNQTIESTYEEIKK